MRLIEQTTKRIQASENTQLTQDRSKTDEAEVAKAEMDFPEDSRVLFDEETPDNPRMEDEKYIFKARLPLPKSLKECRQDVDLHAINITHRFKLMVNIHNPEGHISQVSIGAFKLAGLSLTQSSSYADYPSSYSSHQTSLSTTRIKSRLVQPAFQIHNSMSKKRNKMRHQNTEDISLMSCTAIFSLVGL